MSDTDDLLGIRSVLVVVAHPDDAEFGSGGTLARFARAGATTWVCVVTNGASGSHEPDMTRERLAVIRRPEQEKASATLGVTEVFFLEYEDGYLLASIEVRRDITRLIRRLRPDLVITHDPSRWYTSPGYLNHPDHRATGEATFAAIMPGDTRLIFPELLVEGYEPHRVKHIWLATATEPDHWVDISETIDLKVEALRCHASQVSPNVGEFVKARAKHVGEAHGVGYAEAFKAFSR